MCNQRERLMTVSKFVRTGMWAFSETVLGAVREIATERSNYLQEDGVDINKMKLTS